MLERELLKHRLTVRLFSGIEPEMLDVGNQRLAQCANERTQLQDVEKDGLLQNSGNPKHRKAVENPKTQKIRCRQKAKN